MKRSKKILVAPLDWGLGHATRCIPLINELLNYGYEILLAANGNALTLLKEEFPGLKTFVLPGYEPAYPSGDDMVFKMALQLPKFLKTILDEQLQVEKIVADNNIDIVVSDNRYGCFSKRVKSVFITHQLHLIMPNKMKWIEKRFNDFNHQQINHFAECWVPAPQNSFIPVLTSGSKPLNTRYIGYLSRFKKLNTEKKYDILVICSGPEPQREIFEKLLRRQLKNSAFKYLLVKGLPGLKKNGAGKNEYSLNENLQFAGDSRSEGLRSIIEEETRETNNFTETDFMNSQEMNEAVESSEIIISRPGYSTVMDLARLGKKAIFIPTPGQTEQEYIAEELSKRKIAFSMKQDKFNIATALKESMKFDGFPGFENDVSLLKNAIESL